MDRKQGQGIGQSMGSMGSMGSMSGMGGLRGGAGFSSSPNMVTGGLGKQIPPIHPGAVKGLGNAGSMGLADAMSPTKDNIQANRSAATTMAARGLSSTNFARK